jgi:FtsH-binding integral membrane protein
MKKYDKPGNQFLSRVYMWMFIGLLLTAVTSFGVSSSSFLMALFLGSYLYFILIVVQFAIVLFLIWKIQSLSPTTATLVFIFYAVLSGITITPIFFAYTGASIFIVFLIASGMFIGMSLIGYFTKRDLSGIGRFLYMALIGLIIAMIANLALSIILKTAFPWLDFMISVAAVLIFSGLTAYDTQNIKKIGKTININEPYAQNMAIIGALKLYLDFINIFIHLLRLFGQRR